MWVAIYFLLFPILVVLIYGLYLYFRNSTPNDYVDHRSQHQSHVQGKKSPKNYSTPAQKKPEEAATTQFDDFFDMDDDEFFGDEDDDVFAAYYKRKNKK